MSGKLGCIKLTFADLESFFLCVGEEVGSSQLKSEK